MTTEWVIVNGHILDCPYMRSLERPWEPEERCDCADILGDDDECAYCGSYYEDCECNA